MTTLRQAAQQALEALIDAANVLSAPMFNDAADALRTALEQPEERPWVGLTPEEVLDLFDVNNVYGSKWIEFARTVEAALRSKNT